MAQTGRNSVLDGDDDWQIVFLHGLEGGPAGRKSLFLQKNFGTAAGPVMRDVTNSTCQQRRLRTQVLVPDLEMSLFDMRKRNSLPRCFKLSSCLEGCADTAHEAITAMLAESTSQAEESEPRRKRSRQRFLLAGSSWGGAVALRLLEKGVRPDKVLLFAPALGAKGPIWSTAWPKMQLPEDLFHSRFGPGTPQGGSKLVKLLHGDADDTIPVELSREFATRFANWVDYVEIPGGCHRLNAVLRITKHRITPDGELETVEEDPPFAVSEGASPQPDLKQVVLGLILAEL